MTSQIDFARENMVKQQIRPLPCNDPLILELFNAVPREEFVPPAYRSLAFSDYAIPLAQGQFMLKPREEALMLQALAIEETDAVLEIGTGTGYFTALLAALADSVDTVDLFPEFTLKARQHIESLDIFNVDYITGDAAEGWQTGSAEVYDAIVLTGSLPILPLSYKTSLKIGGRLLAILGKPPVMRAHLFLRLDQTHFDSKILFDTCVPALLNAKENINFTL